MTIVLGSVLVQGSFNNPSNFSSWWREKLVRAKISPDWSVSFFHVRCVIAELRTIEVCCFYCSHRCVHGGAVIVWIRSRDCTDFAIFFHFGFGSGVFSFFCISVLLRFPFCVFVFRDFGCMIVFPIATSLYVVRLLGARWLARAQCWRSSTSFWSSLFKLRSDLPVGSIN